MSEKEPQFEGAPALSISVEKGKHFTRETESERAKYARLILQHLEAVGLKGNYSAYIVGSSSAIGAGNVGITGYENHQIMLRAHLEGNDKSALIGLVLNSEEIERLKAEVGLVQVIDIEAFKAKEEFRNIDPFTDNSFEELLVRGDKEILHENIAKAFLENNYSEAKSLLSIYISEFPGDDESVIWALLKILVDKYAYIRNTEFDIKKYVEDYTSPLDEDLELEIAKMFADITSIEQDFEDFVDQLFIRIHKSKELVRSVEEVYMALDHENKKNIQQEEEEQIAEILEQIDALPLLSEEENNTENFLNPERKKVLDIEVIEESEEDLERKRTVEKLFKERERLKKEIEKIDTSFIPYTGFIERYDRNDPEDEFIIALQEEEQFLHHFAERLVEFVPLYIRFAEILEKYNQKDLLFNLTKFQYLAVKDGERQGVFEEFSKEDFDEFCELYNLVDKMDQSWAFSELDSALNVLKRHLDFLKNRNIVFLQRKRIRVLQEQRKLYEEQIFAIDLQLAYDFDIDEEKKFILGDEEVQAQTLFDLKKVTDIQIKRHLGFLEYYKNETGKRKKISLISDILLLENFRDWAAFTRDGFQGIIDASRSLKKKEYKVKTKEEKKVIKHFADLSIDLSRRKGIVMEDLIGEMSFASLKTDDIFQELIERLKSEGLNKLELKRIKKIIKKALPYIIKQVDHKHKTEVSPDRLDDMKFFSKIYDRITYYTNRYLEFIELEKYLFDLQEAILLVRGENNKKEFEYRSRGIADIDAFIEIPQMKENISVFQSYQMNLLDIPRLEGLIAEKKKELEAIEIDASNERINLEEEITSLEEDALFFLNDFHNFRKRNDFFAIIPLAQMETLNFADNNIKKQYFQTQIDVFDFFHSGFHNEDLEYYNENLFNLDESAQADFLSQKKQELVSAEEEMNADNVSKLFERKVELQKEIHVGQDQKFVSFAEELQWLDRFEILLKEYRIIIEKLKSHQEGIFNKEEQSNSYIHNLQTEIAYLEEKKESFILYTFVREYKKALLELEIQELEENIENVKRNLGKELGIESVLEEKERLENLEKELLKKRKELQNKETV